MKLIIIAVILWILKTWIEHDPTQELEPPEKPIESTDAEQWFEFGI